MKKKHIVIIGLGGVGGYFGFKVCKYNEQKQDFNVSFVARNQSYQSIKEKGLTLLSSEFEDNTTKPNAVFESISEIDTPDLVLICVKEYDLENVCRQLKPVLSKESILLPLMNGADIYERIRNIIPTHTILPSCVYISAHIKKPGVIEHKSNPGKIIFGSDKANPDTHTHWIIELFKNSGIEVELTENPNHAIWTKFLFIASFGLVTARNNSSFGMVCTNQQQKQEAIEIMKEIIAVAYKKGIQLHPDVIEHTFKVASTFPFQTPSSLQLDIYSKNKLGELDLLGGTIIRLGKELNIQTHFTVNIYNEIKLKISKHKIQSI